MCDCDLLDDSFFSGGSILKDNLDFQFDVEIYKENIIKDDNSIVSKFIPQKIEQNRDEEKERIPHFNIQKPIQQNKNLFIVFKENIPENPTKNEKLEFDIKKEDANTDNLKKTKNSSNENQKSIQLLIKFKSYQETKLQMRIDYAKNHFKRYFSKFLKNYANNLIKNISDKRLFLPNYQYFTGNPTEKDNYLFLSFSIQEIFGHYKKGGQKIRYQIKNKELIENILNILNNHELGNNVKYKEIQSFFKMNFEKAIELFYNSQDFEKYANDPKTKYLDKKFKAQKGFSLLEPNGFIKMVKQYEKKLKKESI